ncbi:MAG TPA: DUF2007 domain-containing protein [Anaerolineales bacterium]|nr:DUF2007 domain-containing protein [Anaerolineales bacterium]HQX17451.1 DUF2007 domain-containing protein [Anaerolineales bacterium]
MTESNLVLLTEIQGRWQADIIKGYLALNGIDSHLAQEAIGQLIPTNLDIFGRVEIFVVKEDLDTAQKLMETYFENSETE